MCKLGMQRLTYFCVSGKHTMACAAGHARNKARVCACVCACGVVRRCACSTLRCTGGAPEHCYLLVDEGCGAMLMIAVGSRP